MKNEEQKTNVIQFPAKFSSDYEAITVNLEQLVEFMVERFGEEATAKTLAKKARGLVKNKGKAA